MATTPNVGLGYIAEGVPRADIIINDAFNIIDALLRNGVKDLDATPPPTPANGVAYIVESGATGPWTGKTNLIAIYYDGWRFITPKVGFRLYVEDSGAFFLFDGSAWVGPGTVPNLTGGISATYNQTEVTNIYNKINSLLNSLRTMKTIQT